VLASAAALAVAPATGCGALGSETQDPRRILVPNSPGGGYDSTARILASAIEEAGRERPGVFNVEGGSGAVGLARTVRERGEATLLMMMGLGVVGAQFTQDTAARLDDVTPVSRLLSEPDVLLVPRDSELGDLGALLERWRARPGQVVLGGGSLPGGPDHLATFLTARAAGVPLRAVEYRQYDGGGPLLAALFADQITCAVSGVLETLPQVSSGAVRVLAVTGDEALPRLSAPTLRQQGLDLSFSNWRGVVAPPGLTPSEREELVATIAAARRTPTWRDAVRANGWTEDAVTGDDFGDFLVREGERVGSLLAELGLTA
jgi:putative tricarboxylic transport membrane protein